jgi:hypothetical protein
MMAAAVTAVLATCVLFFAPAVFAQPASDSIGELLVGKAAFGDWRTDASLVRREIIDLPPPYATRSVSNPPWVIAKPAGAIIVTWRANRARARCARCATGRCGALKGVSTLIEFHPPLVPD